MVTILFCVIVAIISCIVSGVIGHQIGYWYGRTLELFESAKRYGRLPEDKDFGEWMSESVGRARRGKELSPTDVFIVAQTDAEDVAQDMQKRSTHKPS